MSKRFFISWHRRLAWVGGFAVLCWALSGILHPVMSWVGPQPVAMLPPAMTLDESALPAMAEAIRHSGIDQARVVKLVAGRDGNLLQITQSETAPRQYFSLESGRALPGHDEQQARWLASHYTGRPMADIRTVEFVTRFGLDYPEVNRLLPVYRVQFAGSDSLVAYIYTETGALASLSDASKATMQTVFQQLHTWTWLDSLGFGRAILIGLFMITLLLMAVGGLILIGVLPARRLRQGQRRWHRRLGYVLWLPLLAWSASGFYHLIQQEVVEPVSGLRLGPALDLSNLPELSRAEIPPQALTAVSLVDAGDKGLLYRLALAPAVEISSRSARFDGRPASTGAVYLTLEGDSAAHSDLAQAARLLGAAADVSEPVLITRFGPDYDFRNKRLPVWQFQLPDEYATQQFVDPATGIVVDQSRQIDRIERWSFSVLHKWSFLTGFTGRFWRDALMVAVLSLLTASALTGGWMLLRRRRQ